MPPIVGMQLSPEPPSVSSPCGRVLPPSMRRNITFNFLFGWGLKK